MTQTTWIIAEIFGGLALLTLLTALVTRWFGPTGRRSPAEILKDRYARGELSSNEYRQMATDLGITIPPASDRSAPSPDRGMASSATSEHAHEP